MTEPPPKEITLPMVFTAVMDFRAEVIEALERQRADLAEGQSLLFQRTDLHQKRLDRLDEKLETVEHEATDFEKRQLAQEREIVKLREWRHDLNGRLTPLFIAVEEIRGAQVAIDERIDNLERGLRKDTEMLPPPPQESEGG